MARIKVQTLRQRKDKEGKPIDAICDVCHKPMEVGVKYTKVKNFYNTWEMHSSCYANAPRSRWETSAYVGAVYDIQDNFSNNQDIESAISDLESLRDETQDKLDNMPDSLQYSPSGELLQERIDDLESVIQELEQYRDDYDEIDNRTYDPEDDEFESEEDFEIQKDEDKDEIMSNVDSALSEIQC